MRREFRRGRRLPVLAAALSAAALMLTPGVPGAAASPTGRTVPPVGSVHEYHMPPPWLGSTHELVIGPDGDNLWVSQQLEDRVLRVSTTGRVVGTIDFPENSGPHGIDKDQRGHVWVTEEFTNALVELDATGKRLARYPLPYPGAGPHGLRIGCDGHTVWWTGKENGAVGSFDPRTHTWTVHRLAADSQPIYLARGPRCAMFFTELTGNRIGRIDADGRLREYDIPTPDSRPIAVAAGRRGHMWFTEEAGAAYAELDPDNGRITEHRTDVPGAKLAGLAFDCFGNLWVQYNQPGLIDRVRPDLTTSRYTLPTTAPVGHRIISGPDGSVWFSELAADNVGSITTGCPPPPRRLEPTV
ncbi:Vgb family protein [Streptomyces tubercidicus]|uniref:Vgb family protein n=1 Tax=Streptomyces tubercidicus TaxID=47759 RepID=UPI0034660453